MTQPTVFVGRTEELHKLHHLLINAINEKALQVAFLGGEVGTGKTTLIERFIHEAGQKFPNLFIAQGKCTIENEMEGLAPFIQVLDDLYKFGKKEKKWWEHLRTSPWFDFFKEVAPAWLDIITGGIVSAAKTTVEEGQKLLQTTQSGSASLFGQFVKLIEEKGKNGTIIIFIDDMQWSDRSSIDLLFYITRYLQDASILILIAYRPSEIAQNKNEFQTIRNNIIRYGGTEIPDLMKGIDVKAYANQLFPKHSFPSSFLDSVQEKTDGYPLFVQQVFDWLQEKQLIRLRQTNSKEEWFLEEQELALIEIPESVQAAIDNRIRQLNNQLVDILTYASVEGEEFTGQIVGELQNLDELKILELLEDLERKYRLVKYVREISLGDVTVSIYRFAHGFYREHIYHSLSPTRRRALHSKVAHALESLYAEHHDLVGSLLARQFELARYPEKAAHYYLMASKEVYKRYAWQESIALAKSGFKIFQNLSENNDSLSKQVETVLVWEACCERLGSYDEIVPVLESTIRAVSSKARQQKLHARLLIALGWTQYYKSDKLAEITAAKAINIAKQLKDVEITYEAQALLSDVLVDELGKYEQGRDILVNQLQIARKLQNVVKEANALAFLSWCQAHIGQYEEAITASRESLDLIANHQIDDPILLAFANRCLGYGLQAQGNCQAGINALNESLMIYERLNDQVRINWCKTEMADALFRQGNLTAAENSYQISTGYAKAIEDFQQVACNYISLAEISIERGELSKAEERLKKAEQALSSDYSGIVNAIWLNNGFIKLYLAKQDFERAGQIMVSTMPLLESIESFVVEISLYNTFGELFRAEGDLEQALEWYQKSLRLGQQIRDMLSIADTYRLLGYVYLELDQKVQSQHYFSLALQIYKAYQNDLRIQQLETLLPHLQSSEDWANIHQIANVSPKYMNPVKLRKIYTCRYGKPSLSYVDTAIFVKKYYVYCMSCAFCHDGCCAYGVDVDIENFGRIKQHTEALEEYIGIPESLWFLPGIRHEIDYPGNQFVRTRVIDGACAFLNRERRGCYLHQYCLENGSDYHELKPIISCIFPLTFDRGLLHPATEIYDETLICFASGPTLYRGLREELLFYFGEELVLELDEIEAAISLDTSAIAPNQTLTNENN